MSSLGHLGELPEQPGTMSMEYTTAAEFFTAGPMTERVWACISEWLECLCIMGNVDSIFRP